MGATASSDEIVFLDFEGGVRNDVWDFFALFLRRGLPARGLRLCRAYTARQRTRLVRDLPEMAHAGLAGDKVVAVTYDKDNNVDAVDISPCATVELAVEAALSKPHSNTHLISWGMNFFDAKALKNCNITPTDSRSLVCGLKFFKQHYVLPKNTMASRAPGTPRAVFNVPQAGSPHGARADTLHLKGVVERAAYALEIAKGQPVEFDHDWNAVAADAYFDAVLARVCHAKPQAALPKDFVPAMWGSMYFDVNGRLLKASSKAFKRHLSEHLKARGKLDKKLQCRINSTKLASSFQRLLKECT